MCVKVKKLLFFHCLRYKSRKNHPLCVCHDSVLECFIGTKAIQKCLRRKQIRSFYSMWWNDDVIISDICLSHFFLKYYSF